MGRRFYKVTRDLHLYVGLFISPFIVLFAASVFVLVHPRGASLERPAVHTRSLTDLSVTPGLENLTGRPRVEALRRLLDQFGIHGEIGFVQYSPKEHRMRIPVAVPGRETEVDLDLAARSASVTQTDTGTLDGLVLLHKSPGPHLAEIRMNWVPLRVWRWFADGTVYLLFFLTLSGIYLWLVLRAERRAGIALLAAGTLSFIGIVYALAG
jgi:hypothetical protein